MYRILPDLALPTSEERDQVELFTLVCLRLRIDLRMQVVVMNYFSQIELFPNSALHTGIGL